MTTLSENRCHKDERRRPLNYEFKSRSAKIIPPSFLLRSDFLEIQNNFHAQRKAVAFKSPLFHPWIFRQSEALKRLLREFSTFMSKLSFVGLIVGLILLGVLFFGVGYLAAVATYGTGKSQQPSWESVSKEQSTPSALDKLEKLGGGVVGKLIQNEASQLKSKLGGGALGGIISKVPAPLKPFANQAQNKVALEAQQSVGLVSNRLQSAFAPRRFGAAQEPPKPQPTPQPSWQQMERAHFNVQAPTHSSQGGTYAPPPQNPFAPRSNSIVPQHSATPNLAQPHPYPPTQQQPYCVIPAQPPQAPTASPPTTGQPPLFHQPQMHQQPSQMAQQYVVSKPLPPLNQR